MDEHIILQDNLKDLFLSHTYAHTIATRYCHKTIQENVARRAQPGTKRLYKSSSFIF